MHILIGLLTLLGAFFYFYRQFHESGAATSLNPFLWKRRRDWQKRQESNPLFTLDEPKDVAAALMFIIAKLDGEVTRETKEELIKDFQNILNMDEEEANATLKQTSFMLEQYPIVQRDLGHILNKNMLTTLTNEQAERIVNHLPVIAERESGISAEQHSWINDIRHRLTKGQNSQVF